MCPDDQTLSALYDGELEEPFHELIETHVAHCERCRERVASFAEIGSYLQAVPEPDFEQSKYNVWNRIKESREMKGNQRFWRRTVAVPMPLAVASGAFIFLFLSVFVLLFSLNNRYNESVSPLVQGEVQQVQQTEVFMADLEKVTRYLESQNNIIEVNMQLPKQSRFIKGGEPQLIREKDFIKIQQ